jgi:hypothetical protein
MNGDSSNNTMRVVATAAIDVIGALEYIRKGRLDRALETLEMRLDVFVVALSALVRQIQSSDREILMQTMRHVRDYRRRYPRRAEADLSGIDKDTAAGANDLQERARTILEDIE